jgi:hypothetical protein
MRDFFEYLNAQTVSTLREIAKQDGTIPGYSKLRKQELITAIEYRMVVAHDEAIKEDAERNPEATYTVPGTDFVLTGIPALVMIRHEKNVRRYNPTMKRDRNGMVILSAKQKRRCAKKLRKYGKEVGMYA